MNIYKTVVDFNKTIIDRVDAGSEYLPMNSAIKRIIENPNYPNYCRLINIKVFGKHMTGMRNIASASELKKIANLERVVISAIDAGFIDNEEKLLKLLETYEVR